jgi:hypothetical protein
VGSLLQGPARSPVVCLQASRLANHRLSRLANLRHSPRVDQLGSPRPFPQAHPPLVLQRLPLQYQRLYLLAYLFRPCQRMLETQTAQVIPRHWYQR